MSPKANSDDKKNMFDQAGDFLQNKKEEAPQSVPPREEHIALCPVRALQAYLAATAVRGEGHAKMDSNRSRLRALYEFCRYVGLNRVQSSTYSH